MSDSDLDMEEKLRSFAASTRTPPLPAETAALPWTVQSEKPRSGALGRLSGADALAGRAGRALFATARLAATLAVAFGLVFAASHTRTSGSASDIVAPEPSPRPSPLPGAPNPPEVVVLPTSGTVDDVMASYVSGGVKKAEADGAAAVIVQLDTLGGSEASMTTIYKALENATIPTIVWVGPSGAKAASAGTFITLSANLAYMAPGTNIGAASPVAAGGQEITAIAGPTEAAKVLRDAVAAMTSRPAKIFGLAGRGTIKPGSVADVAVIDLKKEFTVNAGEFLSKSKNSPFIGWKLKGAAEITIVGGKIVWSTNEKFKS